MKIGILGAGAMGRTLARLFLAAGHEVALANSRGPASLAPLVLELGAGASAVAAGDIAAFGDVVVLATRWSQLPSALAAVGASSGTLRGRVVIDTTNNRSGPRPEDVVDLGGRGSSEVVAGMVPGARLVKAFNHQPIAALDALRVEGAHPQPALFIAGDHAEAKALVAQLVCGIGAVPVDTGSLVTGGRLQSTGIGPLAGHGRLLAESEARSALAAAERRGPSPRGAAPDRAEDRGQGSVR